MSRQAFTPRSIVRGAAAWGGVSAAGSIIRISIIGIPGITRPEYGG